MIWYRKVWSKQWKVEREKVHLSLKIDKSVIRATPLPRCCVLAPNSYGLLLGNSPEIVSPFNK